MSAGEVRIGYIAYSLGDANSLIGLPTPAEARKQFAALVDYYNARGGIQCRKITVKYYEDQLNAPQEHNICLQAQQDKIFAMITDLFTPQERNCLPAAKVTQMAMSPPPTPLVRQYYPYALSPRSDSLRIVRDYVFGARQYGFFKGMGKLGMLDQTCYPELSRQIYADLARIGIAKSSISVYSFGCPTQTTTPDQNLAAALQFKRDGVTHVMGTQYNWPPNFARAADQQSYRPKYALMDDNSFSLHMNANPPVADSLDGMLGITKDSTGAELTPGYRWNPATLECMRISRAAGVDSPVQPRKTAIFGMACAMLKLFVATANATSPLTRVGLPAGMATLGRFDTSYPTGPSVYNDPRNPTGSHFYRAAYFRSSCHCWRLIDGAFRPQFR